jgi:hypothetical protein
MVEETKIPINAIISLVIVCIIVLVVAALIIPIFKSPEIIAYKTLAEEINKACAAKSGVNQITIFMPDSRGNNALNLVFFYLAIDHNKLILARRTFGVENNDILVSFTEFIRNKPGNAIIKETTLSNCENNNVQICGQLDPNNPLSLVCDRFQFESEEGRESLSFTINKTFVQDINRERVILSYAKNTICGDNKCCTEYGENAENCPLDCQDSKPCKPYTQS